MKPLLLTLLLFAGCKSQSFFITANDARKQTATLYLLNKDTISGQLTVTLEDFYHSPNGGAYPSYIEFTPAGKDSAQRIPLAQILGYRMGTTFYALKIVDIIPRGLQNLLFLKQLTPDTSRIQLYELHQSGQANATNESLYSYFLSLPGFGLRETFNTHGIRLLPQFDVKMSEIVADCPALAKKIRAKADGYFIPFTSFKAGKHPEVLLKIIAEYNNCH